MEDGGVGEELHAHQVGQQRGQLVRLVVEGEDVPVPGAGGVGALLLHGADVAGLALGDLLVDGVVGGVDRVGELE